VVVSPCPFDVNASELSNPLHRVVDPNTTYFAAKHHPDSTYQAAKAVLRGRTGPLQTLPPFAKCGDFSMTAGTSVICGDSPVLVPRSTDQKNGNGNGGTAAYDGIKGTDQDKVKDTCKASEGEEAGAGEAVGVGGSCVTSRNDSGVCLEIATLSLSDSEVPEDRPPFTGWIVSGERWESFTVDGTFCGEDPAASGAGSAGTEYGGW
jgi:hypothetical protein